MLSFHAIVSIRISHRYSTHGSLPLAAQHVRQGTQRLSGLRHVGGQTNRLRATPAIGRQTPRHLSQRRGSKQHAMQPAPACCQPPTVFPPMHATITHRIASSHPPYPLHPQAHYPPATNRAARRHGKLPREVLSQTPALPPGTAKPDALGHMQPCFVRWRGSAQPDATPARIRHDESTGQPTLWQLDLSPGSSYSNSRTWCELRARREVAAPMTCPVTAATSADGSTYSAGSPATRESGDSRQTGFLVVNGCKSGNAMPRVCWSHAYRFGTIHQNTARHAAAMLQTEALPDRVACPLRTVTPDRRDDLEPC